MTKYLISVILTLSAFLPGRTQNLTDKLHEGDIFFQDFDSPQSAAVKLATGSEFTHCGILLFDDSVPRIWEALQPVRITPVHEWIVRDTGNHFVVMRLKGADTLLTESVIERLKTCARTHLGKNYDPYFEWSDSALYCSEYVWKIYREVLGIELTPARKLGDYDFSHPLVQEQLAIRYGDSIPVEEPVVAPGDLFNSSLLDTVLVK
ncbi:MAG: YiiX family permuted papain-like enzyme [Candidatus Zixiibacteriota bacterium]